MAFDQQHLTKNYPNFSHKIQRSHDSKMHSINSLLHMHKQEVNNITQNHHTPPQSLNLSGYHRHLLYNNSPSISVESCPDSSTSKSSNSQHSSDSGDSLYSSSPKTNQIQKNPNHHHHSIQEFIRHFGKSVRQWRNEHSYRRASCSEDSSIKPEDEFRGRSKSLDGTFKKKILSDCEATYRIYESILREGTLY